MKDLDDIVKKVSKMKKTKREKREPVQATTHEWLEKAYPPERIRAVKVGGIGYV